MATTRRLLSARTGSDIDGSAAVRSIPTIQYTVLHVSRIHGHSRNGHLRVQFINILLIKKFNLEVVIYWLVLFH